jgi:hypothetical protein
MFLTTWPLPEFTVYGNFLLWIILPVLLISIAITIYWHYRGKARMTNEEFDELTSSMYSENPVIVSRGAHVFFDHSKLIKDYEDKLHYEHARFAALKHDFRRLEQKYTNALGKTSIPPNPAELSPEIFEDFYHAEKMAILDRLAELERVYMSRVEGNSYQAMPLQAAGNNQ